MYPEINILGKIYPSYSVMGILGLIFSIILIYILCKKLNRDFSDYIYVYVFGIIGMLIGAKALYLLVEIKDIIIDIGKISFSEFIYKYINSGMVFYGGLVGALIGSKIEAKRLKLNILEMYKILVPCILLFSGFGRIGCFLTGCCYGKVTDLSLGVVYSISKIAPNGIKLIPVQLIEATFDFSFLCVILLRIKHIVEEKLLDFYLIYYSIFRFILEFFRGDEVRGILLGISTSQWISIIILTYEISRIIKEKSLTKNI